MDSVQLAGAEVHPQEKSPPGTIPRGLQVRIRLSPPYVRIHRQTAALTVAAVFYLLGCLTMLLFQR